MKSKEVREPIATWYEIVRYSPTIEPVRIVAFTEKTVTVLEKQWSLSGPERFVERRRERTDYFPNFAEAKAELIDRAARAVDSAKYELQRRRSFLGQVEAIKEPEAAL